MEYNGSGPLVRHAVKSGSILGSIVVVITFLVYSISIPFMGSFKFVLLVFGLYIGYVLFSGIDFRKKLGGFISFNEAFIHGFVMLAVAGFMGLLFGLILYQIIDKELPVKMTEAILINTEESMRGLGATEDKIEEQLDMMEANMANNFTAPGQVKNYFTGLLWNALFVAITSLVIRKSEPASQH